MFLDFEGFEFFGGFVGIFLGCVGFEFLGWNFFGGCAWGFAGVWGNFCFFGCVWVFGEFVILSLLQKGEKSILSY